MLVLLLLPMLTGCGIEQVDEGYHGIKTVWGKVEGDPLGPGLYFYLPVRSDIFEMDVREHKWDGKEACFTKDTQRVEVMYAITVYPKQQNIAALYSQFGTNWDDKIVPAVLQSSIKDVIGQYIADNLVQNREAARAAAFEEVRASLDARGVVATRLDITNLDFDDAYEAAVEAKVVAVQKAAEAKNKTVEVEERAKQTVLDARAQAEAMKIKTAALAQNKGLVDYEAIQKWNGQLPSIVLGGGSMPIINLDKLTGGKHAN
jgi:prohibitin 2